MRLLLDTQVVLWQLAGTWRPSREAEAALRDAAEVHFSVISFAEIGTKAAIGKLRIPSNLREVIIESGLRILGLDAAHALGVAELPVHHRDPFDRLLISQAQGAGLSILTADRRFTAYDVHVVAA